MNHFFSLEWSLSELNPPQIREAAGRDKELSIENLVDSLIYSDLEATECLK